MASKFPALWFVNPDDRDAIENALLHSPALKRLRQIIADRLDALESKELLVETYKDQSWSHIQAHNNGRKQDLYFILKLLDQGE